MDYNVCPKIKPNISYFSRPVSSARVVQESALVDNQQRVKKTALDIFILPLSSY